MKYKLILSLLLACMFFLQEADAQKFGHINSALIIERHPSVAVANTELEAFQKILTDSFAIKAKAFEAKYTAYLEQANSGSLSQVTSETKQNELRAEQQSLAAEEQQLQFRLLQKREELLKPILAELDSIIQAIGKEGNYTMIFDTSVAGALLYAVESEDLTELVTSRCMLKQ